MKRQARQRQAEVEQVVVDGGQLKVPLQHTQQGLVCRPEVVLHLFSPNPRGVQHFA